MEQQQNCGGNWSKILAVTAMSLSLAGCSLVSKPEPEIQVVTKVEKTQVPVVQRPKPVQLVDTRIFVVNESNIDDFISQFTDINGELAFVALSIKDYENLALNIAELRRYINQQGEIIVYYEEAVSPNEEKQETVNENVVSETSLE